MLVANRLLMSLVDRGEISFTMADLKGRTYAEKKLLISLGAYKSTPVDIDFINNYGIRAIKKLIDLDLPLNPNGIAKIYENAIINANRIDDRLATNIVNPHNPWRTARRLKNLKSWNKISRGKDLFIPGLGGFDIKAAIDRLIKDTNPQWFQSLSVREVVVEGYFPNDETYYTNKLYSHKDLFNWVVVHGFDTAHIDELINLKMIGQFNPRLSLASVNKRIADARVRGLELTWRDSQDFDYPEWFGYLGLTVPKNGIELKKQAKYFSNCSGGYVNQILAGNTYIGYTDDVMVEISPTGAIRQMYGKRNSRVDEKDYTALEAKLIVATEHC